MGRRARWWRGARRAWIVPALALVASCSGTEPRGGGPLGSATATTLAPLVVSPDLAAALVEAAEPDGVHRWTRAEVPVSVGGSPTPRDLEVLDAALAELATLSGVALPRVLAGGTIHLQFAPRDQWEDRGDRVGTEPPTGELSGEALLDWDGAGALTGVHVDIDTSTSQAWRNTTIVHELFHALGLDHVSCRTSVVYGDTDGSPTWELSALDRSLVQAWYSESLPAGTPAGRVRSHLGVAGTEPGCAPQTFDGGNTTEGSIWCQLVFAGPQPCMLVDGSEPPPVPPFAQPTRWVLDGVVHDHDPTRYEVFTHEGRRVLCEREGAGRRPCQYTDGPGPITRVDLWTDGEYVYDSPLAPTAPPAAGG